MDKKIIYLKTRGVIIMTTIEKNIKISDDRRVNLQFDVPENVPIGEANLQITINPIQDKWPTLKDLLKFKGILKDSPIFEGDPVEIQRKMRDE
jgi:hypothetical protein